MKIVDAETPGEADTPIEIKNSQSESADKENEIKEEENRE